MAIGSVVLCEHEVRTQSPLFGHFPSTYWPVGVMVGSEPFWNMKPSSKDGRIAR